MKVKEIMDKEYIYVSPDQDVVEVSLIMEKKKKFTTPVVDSQKKLVGWITSLDVTRGLREGKKKVSDIMHSKDDIVHVHENDPARLAVLATSKSCKHTSFKRRRCCSWCCKDI
jgi:predicted transcriptional regulator